MRIISPPLFGLDRQQLSRTIFLGCLRMASVKLQLNLRQGHIDINTEEPVVWVD